VCGAKECNAVGWYNDRDIIDRVKPAPTFCRYEAPLAAAVAPE